ncbi:unnamed protein product, partial [Mesorhabditis belari]|uniref:Glucosidase 2 subunit beta n=1 Tax=Mesorhabditis belari TaxID=2138241 RepID=A0AAF3EU16_9BILA
MLRSLLLLLGFTVVCAADLPRGVPITESSFYKVAKEFKCLDGSLKIPFDQVNDDYCDCPDGSDEPGTSACPNGRFFCTNDGHSSMFIPSSRVNDKICDCCDGSDEWGSGVQCPNICHELGKATREENERKAVVARKGWAVRQEMARKGKDIKTENEVKVGPLTAERDDLVPTRDELEKKKKATEEAERTAKDEFRKKWEDERNQRKRVKSDEMFTQLDLNADGKLTLDDFANNPIFDVNKDGLVDETEAKTFLFNTEEADKEHFYAQMFDSIKIRLRAIEDEKRDEETDRGEDDLLADENKDAEEVEEDEYEETEDSESDEDKHLDVPPANDDEEYGTMPDYPEEIKTLSSEHEKAREEWQEVNSKVSDLDRQINDAEAYLNQDFGNDAAWAVLKGQCFEYNEDQYTYKLCPFDKAVQKEKNGYSETRLGDFTGWTGKEPRKYSEQMYEKGQQCWNGPQRSTKVIIECGEIDELVESSEPAKCEYQFVFRTPAACNNPDQPEPVHTEL